MSQVNHIQVFLKESDENIDLWNRSRTIASYEEWKRVFFTLVPFCHRMRQLIDFAVQQSEQSMENVQLVYANLTSAVAALEHLTFIPELSDLQVMAEMEIDNTVLMLKARIDALSDKFEL